MTESEKTPVDPRSPLGVARSLVEKFAQEGVSPEQFLQSLDRYDEFLQQWADDLQKIPIPPDYEDAPVMLEASLQGLQQIADGVGWLRQFAETGEPELAEQGLGQIEAGQQLLTRMHSVTDENLEELSGEFLG